MVAPAIGGGIRSAQPADPVTATIAISTALSGIIDLNSERLHRIAIPAAWTAAAITFQSSVQGQTFNDLYTTAGEYTIPAAVVGASRSIVVDPAVFYGVRFLKIRSGTAATPVNQVAERALSCVTVPR